MKPNKPSPPTRLVPLLSAWLAVSGCGGKGYHPTDAEAFSGWRPTTTTPRDAAVRQPVDTNYDWDNTFAGPTTVVIQESPFPNDGGFVGLVGAGAISTSGQASVAGWTGNGFIENTNLTSAIVYSVYANFAGPATVSFRYAFGGMAENRRDAYMVVNGEKVDGGTILAFPYTASADGGKWNTWAMTTPLTIQLVQGENQIRITPNTDDPTVKALANIDYLEIQGFGLRPGSGSTAYYKLNVATGDSVRGYVIVSPSNGYYPEGSIITVEAVAYPGYEFESWTGTRPAMTASLAFSIQADTALSARFLLPGARQPEGLVGYGAVQDDQATPYILTGGNEGSVVAVTDLPSLRSLLASPDPYVVVVTGTITSGSDTVSTSLDVASNKTIYGDGTGHLRNIELKFSGENYLVRNLIVSQVVAADMYQGTGNDGLSFNGARHVWVDHCELYSTLAVPDPAYTGESKDYYDGLIDLKNGASFITISNTYFHDHWKVMLIGSGDDPANAPIDSATRVTLHHNHFRQVISRMPLIRFGKAHIFNNFYEGTSYTIDSTVNARRGSTVFVEGNYTLNAKYTVVFLYDTSGSEPGLWNLKNNRYMNCQDIETVSTTNFQPTYAWTADQAATVPGSVPAAAGVGKISVP